MKANSRKAALSIRTSVDVTEQFIEDFIERSWIIFPNDSKRLKLSIKVSTDKRSDKARDQSAYLSVRRHPYRKRRTFINCSSLIYSSLLRMRVLIFVIRGDFSLNALCLMRLPWFRHLSQLKWSTEAAI